LHTLADDETIARLATGVKRFKFPDGHNPIAIYKEVYRRAHEDKRHDTASDAAATLAGFFQDRRQYVRAAEYWRLAIEHRVGEPRRPWERQLAQIENPWGQFGGVATQPAGRGATVDFRFRTGERVELSAQRVDVDKLLADVRAYLESQPKRLDWDRLQIEDLGYRLLKESGSKYLGEPVAEWSQELEPADGHFDKRITLTTPLQRAGAYLVTAKMAPLGGKPGNTSKLVLWVADTAIVRKPLDGQMLYYVADAVSGKPVAGATVEFFGYRQDRGEKPNDFRVQTERFARKTDADGLVTIDAEAGGVDPRLQWLATVRTDDGRLAYLGFRGVWRATRQQQSYDAAKAVVLTDRPVYRPGQTVNFKAWIARARYGDQSLDNGEATASEFAHKAFQVRLFNAKNEKVLTQQLTANAYGGIAGEYVPSESDPLGVYRIEVAGYGQGTFRVEEYKKPEFEVTVGVSENEAPAGGVRLGESFTATIEARYYFGSPVTSAKVKYKVVRTERSEGWFPVMPWDWLYGRGYWWAGGADRWYPGWSEWGCRLPAPAWSWWWRPAPPPEVVAQGEAAIGEDGTLAVTIDTALAKELHGDSDHDYQITAEVTDRSRRTIVGSGGVLAARKTIQTLAWLDGGYYRVGDTMTVRVATRRPDGSPLAAGGQLRLLQVTYPKAAVGSGKRGEPVETEVRRWELATAETGDAELKFKASEPGRYRISYTATDDAVQDAASPDTAESACLFTVIGDGFDDGDFEFDDVEIVLDRQQYSPGDTARLQINANRRGGTVLLFVRPSNGVYTPPQVVRLEGKSAIVPLDISRGDMPNCFVEAVTVHGGRVHRAVREIIVPPESSVADVEVLPSSDEYRPGEEATIKLRVTDAKGEPVVGDTVVSIYDRSVDYIAFSGNAFSGNGGGSNTPDLREHFWKWRRSHRPHDEHSLMRYARNLVPPGERTLEPIGVFGWQVVDDLVDGAANELRRFLLRESGGRPGGAAFGGEFGGGGADVFSMPMLRAAPASAMTLTESDAVLASGDKAGESAGSA
ncbi:MAG: MG2 domain-containing protein, partial [Planctomycetota bacterium]